jgi:hypothetical protein
MAPMQNFMWFEQELTPPEGNLHLRVLGQKTVPMSEYFIWFIIPSVFIQIRWLRHQIVDKIKYYHPDFFPDLVLGLGFHRGWCFQDSETLGQFFEPL